MTFCLKKDRAVLQIRANVMQHKTKQVQNVASTFRDMAQATSKRELSKLPTAILLSCQRQRTSCAPVGRRAARDNLGTCKTSTHAGSLQRDAASSFVVIYGPPTGSMDCIKLRIDGIGPIEPVNLVSELFKDSLVAEHPL